MSLFFWLCIYYGIAIRYACFCTRRCFWFSICYGSAIRYVLLCIYYGSAIRYIWRRFWFPYTTRTEAKSGIYGGVLGQNAIAVRLLRKHHNASTEVSLRVLRKRHKVSTGVFVFLTSAVMHIRMCVL